MPGLPANDRWDWQPLCLFFRFNWTILVWYKMLLLQHRACAAKPGDRILRHFRDHSIFLNLPRMTTSLSLVLVYKSTERTMAEKKKLIEESTDSFHRFVAMLIKYPHTCLHLPCQYYHMNALISPFKNIRKISVVRLDIYFGLLLLLFRLFWHL